MWQVLKKELWFPDPRDAVSLGTLNGLVAVGGDLSIERLVLAYRSGIFPWSADPITWWSPDPRGILELDELHISRSLAKVLRQEHFRVTRNQAFREVMRECAAPRPDREKTWIAPKFLEAYGRLHDVGHAHSVECWQNDVLVGGVYGVQVGGLFAGESMFHTVSNASKVALVHLVNHLAERGFRLFDIQMVSPHTESLGARRIGREEFLRRLREAVRQKSKF